MKNKLILLFVSLIFTSFFTSAANRYWVASSAANWNDISNWSTTSGGAGGASIPGAGDFVLFNASGIGNCNLDIAASFDGINITGYTGVIDLGAFSFNPNLAGTTNCTFQSGTINGTSILSYTSTNLTIFSGTTFNVSIDITSNRIGFNGGVFNESVTVVNSGSGSYNGIGGCTFHSTFHLTNQGTGYIRMGYTTPDVFNQDITLLSTSTSRIVIGYGSIGNEFNGDVTVGCTNGAVGDGGVWLGETAGSGLTLAATKKIIIDPVDGFTNADLRLRGLTQIGGTAQNFSLSGTARFMSVESTINGNMNVDAPNIILNGSSFAGLTEFEKTGPSNSNSVGGNTFTGNSIMKNSGSGYFLLGNGVSDAFEGDLSFTNVGPSSMFFGYASVGNTVAGDLLVQNSGIGTNSYIGIAHLEGSTVSVSGNTTVINDGSSTISSRIYLANSGSVSLLGDATFTNEGTANYSEIYLANYETASADITGVTTVTNLGINVNSYLFLGRNGDVTFNNDLQVTNSATATNSVVFFNQYPTSLNTYNGNIIVEATVVESDGVKFGNAGGIGVLAATKTVTVGGAGFIAGDLQFRNFTQTGATAQSLNCTGTTRFYNYDSNWGGDIVVISPRIFTEGTTYNGTSYLEKNGAISDNSSGGNTFVGNCELRNSGSDYFLMGNVNPDEFQADLEIKNTGTANIHLAFNSIGNSIDGDFTINNQGTGNSNTYICYTTNSSLEVTGSSIVNNSGTGVNSIVFLGTSGDIVFDGTLTITNSSTATNSSVYANHSLTSLNAYNQDIMVENTNISADGVFFGRNNGAATLAATKTITIGGAGFISSELYFRNFTQIGATAQTLTCTGTTRITNFDSNWGGNVAFTSPRIITRGTVYNGLSYLEKSGASSDASAGGNTFVLDCELRNSGSGYFLMGNGASDEFQANLEMNNTGTNRMYLAYHSTGNSVAGTLNITNIGTGSNYIYLSSFVGSDITVAGVSEVTNIGSGAANVIYLGLNGSVIFNGDLNIHNSSTASNAAVELNYGVTSNNLYNENISVESTIATVSGVRFGRGNGTGTLAATKTVSIGGSGFIAGDLLFQNFTQIGATLQSLLCTGTARIYNYNSNWGGNVTFIAPRMLTRETTYNGITLLEKSGANSDASFGGNIFMLNTELKNSGSGYFLMGNALADAFQANLLINNTGTHYFYLAYNSAGNTVDGTLTINNTGTNNNNLFVCSNAISSLTVSGSTTVLNNGTGANSRIFLGYAGDIVFDGTLNLANNTGVANSHIYCNYSIGSENMYNGDIVLESTNLGAREISFGGGNGLGTLAATKTVAIGGAGYIGKEIKFRNFTQIGATAQALTCTGATKIYNYDSNWGGAVTFIAPRINTRGTVYDGDTYLEKKGAISDASIGGNIFNANAIFKNTSTDYFMPSNSVSNDFNGNATYIKTSSGVLYPSYNCENTYAGNITVEANSTVRFGAAINGRIILDGAAAQSINKVGATPTPEFRDLQTSNTADEITLNTPIIVIVELDLNDGNLISSDANLIYMNNNSTVSSVSDDAFVDGPLEKIGNDAFVFPVGDAGVYQPIAMTAPSSGSARFKGEYFNTDVAPFYDDNLRDPEIDHVSDCEYWILDRIASGSNVSVTLGYKPHTGACSGVLEPSSLVVARWNGLLWKNEGNGGTTGTLTTGTVITAAPVTSFSPFILATLTDANPLPIELIDFKANLENSKVNLNWQTASEKNNDYFTLEKSKDGINFVAFDKVNGAGNSSTVLNYSTIDENPYIGISYYRLKQTDFDGEYTYSNVKSVNNTEESKIYAYPNPFNDVLKIVNVNSNFMINVYSIAGDLIYSGNETSINSENWAKGIYQVLVIDTNGNQVESIRVIK